MKRIFLLSPANLGGVRGRRILSGASRLDFENGVALGEVFTYISSLYFRGKLGYAQSFGSHPALVITAGFGLMPAHSRIEMDQLKRMAEVPIDAAEALYREPLERDAGALDSSSEIVLLGSVATPKYLEPLLRIFGDRLLIPGEFIGLGDMSRGGLMLNSIRTGQELTYLPAITACAPILLSDAAERNPQSA
jgi:hypothetical protein